MSETKEVKIAGNTAPRLLGSRIRRAVAVGGLLTCFVVAAAIPAGASTVSSTPRYSQPGQAASTGAQCIVGAPRVNVAATDVVGVVVTLHDRRTGAVQSNFGFMIQSVTGQFFLNGKWYDRWAFNTVSTDTYNIEWTFVWYHNGTGFYAEDYYGTSVCAPSAVGYSVTEADLYLVNDQAQI